MVSQPRLSPPLACTNLCCTVPPLYCFVKFTHVTPIIRDIPYLSTKLHLHFKIVLFTHKILHCPRSTSLLSSSCFDNHAFLASPPIIFLLLTFLAWVIGAFHSLPLKLVQELIAWLISRPLVWRTGYHTGHNVRRNSC